MGTIKYKYALNREGEKIKIDDVTPEIRKATKFTCISCGNELLACLGETNKHHFRHKIPVDCSLETYLHEMGKYTFIKTYKDCLANGEPFNINIKQKVLCERIGYCPIQQRLFANTYFCKSNGPPSIDLTQDYDIITREKMIGSFRADVLLESSKGHPPVLIEIKVSHPCEKAKIQSGYRIIEIELNKEEDLGLIESRQLRPMESLDFKKARENDHAVRFYNFPETIKELLNYYTIYQFGVYRDSLTRFCLDEKTPCGNWDKLIERHMKENKLQYEILFFDESGEHRRFVFGVARACERGIKVRNCFLCRYHNNGMANKHVICTMFAKQQDSTQAVNCHAFTPDKKAYEPYLSYFDKFEEHFY